AAQGDAAPNVPGAGVLEWASPLVVALHPARLTRARRYQLAPPGLNRGLLVRRDDLVARAQSPTLPEPRVEVEDDPGLLDEPGVARVHPAHVPPGFEGWRARIRCTVRRLMTTPSPRTTCGTLLAKWRLRGRSNRLGSSQAMAITSASTQSANCCGRPGRGASRSENPASTQPRRHLQTHEALWPRRCAASGLRRSGCSWSRRTSRARCTSPCGRACEQAQAQASATSASEKRGWYLGGGPPCQ